VRLTPHPSSPSTKGSVSELAVAEEWGGERDRGSESASHPSPVLS
jgi:hypothetical protein